MTYNNLYQSRWNVVLFLFIEVLEPVDIGSKVLQLIKIWKVIWSGYLRMASPYIILV